MEWIGDPPFQKLCIIHTVDGGEYKARLIKLNKYAGKKILWRREDDVPKKQRFIQRDEVVGWEEVEKDGTNNYNG